MVSKLEDVSVGVRDLAEAYRKQLREQQRMVRLSDRMQLDLHNANQRLAEQAEELLALNQKLTREIDQRKKLETELRSLAVTDSLTGLFTRRHLLDLGGRELQRSARTGSPLSLLLMDLDHFKKINDQHGHAAGDEALRAFATVCGQSLRATDIMGRIGGEEFAIFLPDTDSEGARQVAERLRVNLAEREVGFGEASFVVTASIGIAACLVGERGLDQAFSNADKALYQAKAQGRNCTVVWVDQNQSTVE
ncbi:MAG: GGDEF domain-containing protein [Deltaproteobacteria bacterium]|nr:GGDEF domain-containing protein [Deltaproteobacteria bacterium]